MPKTTIERAREIEKALLKKYHYGKSNCPKWFSRTCIIMEQGGEYGVSVCIPSWSSITETEQNELFEKFEGINIHLRVVVAAPKYERK